ncbi:CTD small phosphatase-like protein 2 [Monoraphidium neglectum]|uniref:CTD small phosphatase-like protein 2 n=1 Tax=Monoraphidium neglectum TaxID=145388 RepID=A0A0D2NR25_9CHLO|nr:CTD small phosphatase-like protein 2 [Monoraphidium neglectum]KIZ06781.1 CTD small phosphatase-like protein 2 [Monoraphidium neglectum]|eukprot:XP_013905800.1 CTD small phosphatase-like protein 2 [Monoraphidium neglectum]
MLGRLVASLWTPSAQREPLEREQMTVEAGAQPAQPSTATPNMGDEQQQELITSCKRRGPEAGDDISPGKRQRLPSATDVRGSSTDFQRQQDQRKQAVSHLQGTPEACSSGEQQEQQQKTGESAKARGPLGHILTPVYYLWQQGSHIAQHFGTPGSGTTQPPQQQQPQQQQPQQQPQQQQQQQQQQQRQQQRRLHGDDGEDEQQHEGPHSQAWQVQRLDEPLDGAACVAQQPQQQQHAAGECATSTTSTVTTGSVLAPEASDSVAGDAAAGAPSVRGFESGCDSDIDPAGELACAGVAMPPAAAAEVDDEDDEEWFDPLLFISRLPPAAPPGALRPGTLLPRRTRACKQKTLVLDLDETLVHSTLDGAPGSEGAHFHFPVHFNGAEHMVHVRMRPHMRDFLERTSELFEVVVFTASQKVYAEKLLNILDPHRRLVRHRIYRDSCVFVDGNYLKDLSGLGRDLAHTAIVDNSPQAFGFQVDNGIPIESWYDDDADTELLQLLPLLRKLADADDVRPLLRERFRLRERVEGAAATWRSRMEQEAAAWQRQCVGSVATAQQQPALPMPPAQQAQQQSQQAGSGMMQQALPPSRQLKVAVVAAATHLS